MSWVTTLGLAALAGALVAVTYATRARPVTALAEAEQGTALTPLLTDPLAVKSLEVIGFDEQSARARGFKVEFDQAAGRWVIPSAFNYPVEATQTMATAASGFVNLLRERVVTDRPEEHQRLGVLDPSDESVSGTSGRGTRVTLRDGAGKVLADLILGLGVKEDGPGASTRKYVRETGRNRVYVTSAQMALSTRLVDWLNADLVNVPSEEVRGLEIVRYRIDESTGKVKDFSRLELTRAAAGGAGWTLVSEPGGSLGPGQSVDAARVEAALAALRETKVVGVRPKPANLAKILAGGAGEGRMTVADQANLQARGFFLTPQGAMMANEGQINVTTVGGVVYTLWLGELALDEVAKEQASGATGGGGGAGGEQPGRYVMLTASVDETVLGPVPQRPAELVRLEGLAEAAGKAGAEAMTEADKALLAEERAKFMPILEAHTQKVTAARTQAQQLSRRWSDWYYVAIAQELEKLRPTREGLMAALLDGATGTGVPTLPTPMLESAPASP
jgi:hypothetical protein